MISTSAGWQLIGWYVRRILRIDYRKDQKNLKRILYTDPTDLFLNGVMDTRRGTCGNMALLWVVLGRRLGLPVSLACVGAHFICRYDDGRKVFNIEATFVDGGDWCSPPDRYYLREYENKIPQRAVDCGSDLRALTPREMLAVFFGAAPATWKTPYATTRPSGITSWRGYVPAQPVFVHRPEPGRRAEQHRAVRAERKGASGRVVVLVAASRPARPMAA